MLDTQGRRELQFQAGTIRPEGDVLACSCGDVGRFAGGPPRSDTDPFTDHPERLDSRFRSMAGPSPMGECCPSLRRSCVGQTPRLQALRKGVLPGRISSSPRFPVERAFTRIPYQASSLPYLFWVNFFSSDTVSACRPLSRRAASTRRPPLELIRRMKPKRRLRGMRFG